MRVYVIDSKGHGEREVAESKIPNLIKARKPDFFDIRIEGKWFHVCVDLDASHGLPRITGLNKRMDKVYLINNLVVFNEDMTDKDVRFVADHVEEIMDSDFDDNYYAIVGIQDIREVERKDS